MANGRANGGGWSSAYTRWGLYVSAVSAIAIIIAAFIWVGQIASEVSTGQKEQEEQLRRLGKIEGNIGQLNITIGTLSRDEREVETQFCANDIVRNLMHANEQRELAILWEKVYGSKYPTDNAYYPNICNRPNVQQ